MDQNILAQLFAREQAAQQSLPPEQVGAQQPMAQAPQAPAQGQPMAPQGQPAQGGMDPMQAMQQIASQFQPTPMAQAPQGQPEKPQTGMRLSAMKDGRMGVRVPVDQPLLALFGMKKNVPVNSPNYYDSLVGTYGEDTVKAFLPGNTPLEPSGKPFISGDTLTQLNGLLPKSSGKMSPNDMPSKKLGETMLAKILDQVSGDKTDPRYLNAKDYMEENGGIPLSKLGEFNSAFGIPTKENDFVQDKTSGLMLKYNRASETYEPVPGQTTGIVQALSSPVTQKLFADAQTRFDSDPAVKEAKKAIEALGNVSAILESNNPAEIGILYGNIAKGLGKEAGALTEDDIKRTVGDPGYANSLYRWYEKKVDFFRGKGQLSEKDLKDFRGLLRDIAGGSNKRYQKAVDTHIRSTRAKVPGLSDEFIRSAFDVLPAYTEAPQRRAPGEATNHPSEKPTAGATQSGTKWKIIK